MSRSFTKICVSVNSEEELLSIMSYAAGLKIPCALIKDNGKTEFGGVPTYTCCAIGPAQEEDIDKVTGGLPLL
jgi:PTH2 family peptidyl-tRNA hydrolase